MTRKLILSTFSILLFILTTTACSDKATEEKLDGVWVANTTETEDGETMQLNWRMKLDKDSKKMLMTLKVGGYDIDDILSIKLKGSWKASSSTLFINIDEDATEVVLNPLIEGLATLGGEDMSGLKDELISELEDEVGSLATMEIVRLTADRLIVKEDDTRMTFHRKGQSNRTTAVENETPAQDYVEESTIATEKNVPSKVHFTGKIGKFPVEMELTMNENGTVTGRHRYTKTGTGAWLSLSGSNGETMNLIERNASGDVTGTFNGTVENAPGHRLVYRGTFVNFQGRQFDFTLEGTF